MKPELNCEYPEPGESKLVEEMLTLTMDLHVKNSPKLSVQDVRSHAPQSIKSGAGQ